MAQQAGLNLEGQLALVNSAAYPARHQLGGAKLLAAPRLGIAYTLDPKTVVRTGYGLSWVSPEQINYSHAPFQSTINAATTTMVTSLNGGLTPLNTLSNPFPNGLIQPAHLSFSVLQINTLTPDDLKLGQALLNTVPNPFYNVLPPTAGTLALPTVTAGQLRDPSPSSSTSGTAHHKAPTRRITHSR